MKTVVAKLYFTQRQEAQAVRFLDVGRWVYNRSLEHRIKAYKRRGESIYYKKQQLLLTRWRSRMDFLRSVPAQIERDALRRVERGFKAFFRRLKSGDKPGFPRFKCRDRWHSFEVLQPGKYIQDGNRVFIPGIGPVRYRGMKGFSGVVRGVRVVRKARGWYCQLIVNNGDAPQKRPIALCVGIDLGLSSLATLSTGESLGNPRWNRQQESKIARCRRIVSRRSKGSHRQLVARKRLARMHQRISDSRHDWIHKEARKLVNRFDLIAVEDVNIKGLCRSRLAKSFSDASWGCFLSILLLKAESAGVTIVRVDPRNTTQECSECGFIVPKALGDRMHSCSCGYVACRDVNAARNILRRATVGSDARGESGGLHHSLNRERVFGKTST